MARPAPKKPSRKAKPSKPRARRPAAKRRAKRKPGRPGKLTAARRAAILAALEDGHYVETAARLGGVAPSTLYAWRAEFPEFLEAIERARAKAEDYFVGIIRDAAASGGATGGPVWTAAAWMLERTRAERFGRLDRSKITIEKPGSGADEMDLTLLSDDELATLEAIARKGRAPAEGETDAG